MDDFWFFKLANLFLSFLFLLWAWCIRKFIGAWLNPISIFLLFWFLYTAFPLLVAFEVPVNPYSIIYIFLFSLVFSLPCFLFQWSFAFKCNDRKPPASYLFNTKIMRAFIYIFSGGAVITMFIGMSQQGISLGDILNSPLTVGGQYADKRYAGKLVSTIYSQLSLQFTYCAVVFGGLVYGSRNTVKNKKILLVSIFLPALLVMLLQSAKGLFFFSIFLFFGGVLVTRVYEKNFTLIGFRSFRNLLVSGVLIFPVLVASFMSRGAYGINDFSAIVNHIRYYLVSYSSVHLPAFSDWFTDRYFGGSIMHYNQEALSMGFYTFMSFFQLAGDDRDVPMGTYEEYFSYGEYLRGNLYTIFRGLISDFGLIGSLVFGLTLGSVCCAVYWRLLVSRKSAFSIIFFIYFVAFCYQSFTVSSFTWLTIPFVFFIQWIILFFLMNLRVFPRVK